MKEYIRFPLSDGTERIVTTFEGEHFERMFPNLNVAQEFCAMLVWLECNPSRRKTKRGINRFIASWLIRAAQRQEAPSKVRSEAQVGRHYAD